MPNTNPLPIVINVATIRTILGSVSKYPAKPPHTPPIFESVEERIRRLGPAGRVAATSAAWGAPQLEQKFEYSAISLRQFGQIIVVLLSKNLPWLNSNSPPFM